MKKVMFFEWCKTQMGKDNPIGDLAGDVVSDGKSSPEVENYSLAEWHKRIKRISSNDELVMDAFSEAKKAYRGNKES